MSGRFDWYHPVAAPGGAVDDTLLVPESCIESCETILRWHDNADYKFEKGFQGSGKGRKAMKMELKTGWHKETINVTDSGSRTLFSSCKNLSSFFKEDDSLAYLLQIGEGVAFINTGKGRDTYNMHFLAALIIEHDGVTLSDVSEPDDWDGISQVEISTVKAKTIADLREQLGAPYTDTSDYVVGKVRL